MVTRRSVIFVVAVAAFGLMAFFWFFSGDEARIKKQFQNLSELASKDSSEHELIAAAAARKIGNMFADTCRIEIPSHSISRTLEQRNIQANVMLIRSRYSTISLTFHDIQIRFPEKNIAQIAFTAFFEGTGTTGQPFRQVNEFVTGMEKIEKDWYFTRIETVTVLEK